MSNSREWEWIMCWLLASSSSVAYYHDMDTLGALLWMTSGFLALAFMLAARPRRDK